MSIVRKYWPVSAIALAAALGMAIRNSGPTSLEAAPTPTMVTVANTPLPVGNTAAAPLYARVVDNPAHHPFAREISCSVPDGSKNCTASFTSDSGKELVIETVSVFAQIPIGGRAFGIISTTTGGVNLNSVRLPATFEASYAGSVDEWVGTQTLRLYADPSSIVVLQGGEQPVGAANFVFDVSGYTVDCGVSATTTNPCALP